ncbi:MAG TPA: hypothetical protein VLM05_15790, partial [Mycobacteriales bacterium]|nr:hypothetical protein [Mycobacteriales bacterium]
MLDELGWDAEWTGLVAGRPGEPARVVRADTGHALLATAAGVAHVRAPGLVTGDWVLHTADPDPAAATVVRLPR